MESGMDITPLEVTQNSYALISYNRYYARVCEVERLEIYDACMVTDLRKSCNFC
jgi:hypothetical protein